MGYTHFVTNIMPYERKVKEMGKKGFLIIDRCKNAVILTPSEFRKCEDLHVLLMKNDIIAEVRQNENMKQLNACVREYLKGGWEEGE